jgi:sugar transferase (PEP-CTERM/EpsH1 system associated)
VALLAILKNARSPSLNILFLSQRVPYPPDRGDRITTHHVLRHLLDRGADVRVGCLAEDEQDLESAKQIDGAEVFAARIHQGTRKFTSLRGLASGEPLTLPFFRSRELTRTVSQWIAEDPPDLIHVYSSSMAQYVTGKQTAARIMQFAELDSDKWAQYAQRCGPLSRWIYRREAQRLLTFEQCVAREFDISLVVSDVEKTLFMDRIPEIEPVVLPNGVDVDAFTSRGDDERDTHTLIFTGVMDYEPNVDGVMWFVDKCWPSIRRAFADARLLIVGSRPTRSVRDLVRHPGVEVTGRVPETQPYFDQAAVAIAPLRLARGVQNKVLEAMSMSVPVVASPQAAQGLGDLDKDTLCIADGSAATTEAVCKMLSEPQMARSMGQRAAQFVRDRFRWEHSYAILDRVIETQLKLTF